MPDGGGLVIRQVELRDVTACGVVEQLCFAQAEAATVEILRRRAALYPEGFLVAELNGEIVGICDGGATNLDHMADAPLKHLIGHDPEGRHLAIFGLAVRPECQGRGIAQALLESYIVRARVLGKQGILLLCKPALVPFYQRFGFVDEGDSDSEHGGVRWRQMKRAIVPVQSVI